MTKYWYLWALIVILIPITAFVCYKAAVATKQAREEREKTVRELEEGKKLKDEFSGLSAEQIRNSDETRLMSGMALLVDLAMRKEIRPNEAFSALPREKQLAYTLNCILEDSDGGVSSFFRKNTEPISSLAAPALREAGLEELSLLFASVYPMFDEENEQVSFDEEKLKAADEKFRSIFNETELKTAAALYIKSNAAVFAEN